MWSLLLALACLAPHDDPRIGPGGSGSGGGGGGVDSGTPDTDAQLDSGHPRDTGAGGACPDEMVEIDDVSAGRYCIDRYEAHIEGHSPYLAPQAGVAASAVDVVPQGYISGEVAALACDAAGKRLCHESEWLRACQGPDGRAFPYGDVYDADACNTEYPGGHPVVDYFGTADGVWDLDHMNDPGINQQPDTVAPAGAFWACESAEGIFDLHGNLHEWIADEDGTFLGGFYADASINGEGCAYRTTAHPSSWHDYSTGFRCCADPS